MIDAGIETASAIKMPSDELHYEVFQADTSGDPFTVEVVSDERKVDLQVESEQTLLEVVRDAGFEIGSSCETGNCGTCRIKIRCGEVQHRGSALTKTEQRSEMLSCVSRGIGHIVVELPEC
jgi:ferredoxin